MFACGQEIILKALVLDELQNFEGTMASFYSGLLNIKMAKTNCNDNFLNRNNLKI